MRPILAYVGEVCCDKQIVVDIVKPNIQIIPMKRREIDSYLPGWDPPTIFDLEILEIGIA